MSEHEPWPSVGVVVPTRDRPQELRRAVSAIRRQRYPGRLAILVVFDGAKPDPTLAGDGVQAVENGRRSGLAGARNTGVLAVDTDLVAFCDDDDEWFPDKLRLQVESLLEAGGDFVTCGMVVAYEGSSTVRLAGTSRVTHAQLLRSRMPMLHSSTFVIRRSALVDEVGLVDEAMPGGFGEDWDLLLRASARRPIVHVDAPLVRVSWTRNSHFDRAWQTKAAGLRWMLDHHPDIAEDRRAAARVYGQIAFAFAALRESRRALSWSAKAIARSPLEPRAYLAAAIAARVASPDAVLHWLHARGRGV